MKEVKIEMLDTFFAIFIFLAVFLLGLVIWFFVNRDRKLYISIRNYDNFKDFEEKYCELRKKADAEFGKKGYEICCLPSEAISTKTGSKYIGQLAKKITVREQGLEYLPPFYDGDNDLPHEFTASTNTGWILVVVPRYRSYY